MKLRVFIRFILLISLMLYSAGNVQSQIIDTDGDGIEDADEIAGTFGYFTDPFNPDTDGDGFWDGEEIFGDYGWFTDPTSPDTDGDSLFDDEEIFGYNGWFTDPTSPDTDGDGLRDDEEVFGLNGWFTDPTNPDSDGDSLFDSDEIFGAYGWFTDPTSPDSDGDSLFDGEEIFGAYGWVTDPLSYDTDGDGLYDNEEVFGLYGWFTDPTNFDSDGDTLLDGEEIFAVYGWATNPVNTDTDGDGLWDDDEIFNWYTDPILDDSDGDGISDGDEVANGSNPLDPNSPPQTDIYEPDNDPLYGEYLYDGYVTANHTIHDFDDIDWYFFDIVENSLVYLYTDGNAYQDTVLFLYDSAMNLIIWDDDSGLNLYSRITVSLAPGTYYASVDGFFNQTVSSYVVYLEIQPSIGDLFENDNLPEYGEYLFNGYYSGQHSIHNSTDVDWFYFDITQESSIHIETSGEVGGDTYMELYDGGLNLILSDDNSGTNAYSMIDWILQPDVYYVVISGYLGSTINYYDVYFTATPSLFFAPDEFEVDDLPEWGESLANGFYSGDHSIHNSTDIDWFIFELTEESEVHLETTGLFGGDTVMQLFDGNQVYLTENDDKSFDDLFSLIEIILGPGIYYVSITGFMGTGVESFQVYLESNSIVVPPSEQSSVPSSEPSSESSSESTPTDNPNESSSAIPSLPLPISFGPVLLSIFALAMIQFIRKTKSTR